MSTDIPHQVLRVLVESVDFFGGVGRGASREGERGGSLDQADNMLPNTFLRAEIAQQSLELVWFDIFFLVSMRDLIIF